MEGGREEELEGMKVKLKGGWVVIWGRKKGWGMEGRGEGDCMGEGMKEENKEMEEKNGEVGKRKWEKGEKKKMIGYKELGGV